MKRHEKFLKSIARQLPDMKDECYVRSILSPEQISESDRERAGVTHANQQIVKSTLSTISANHYRRLRRAYSKSGAEGVVHYLKKFVKPEAHSEVFTVVRNALVA